MCIAHRRSPRAAEPIGYILDQLNITKECCRVRIMTGMEFKNYYNVLNPTNLAPTVAMLGVSPGAVKAPLPVPADEAAAPPASAKSRAKGKAPAKDGDL